MTQQQPNTSLAGLVKANHQLRAAAQVAKKVQTQRDFNGPCGDYICRFNGTSINVKDGRSLFILRFAIDGAVEGQGDYNGASLDIVHGLHDDERSSAQQKLERLFADIQRLGIDTAEATLEQIDQALQSLKNRHVTIRLVKNKDPNKSPYRNIRGLAQEGRSEPDYSQPAEDEAPAPPVAAEPAKRGRKAKAAPAPVDPPAPAEDDNWDEVQNDAAAPFAESDEWNDELAEAETQDAAEEPQWNPTDWAGFDVEYKPKNAPKPLKFKVVSGDDAAGTVILERDGRRIRAAFADLILPQ